MPDFFAVSKIVPLFFYPLPLVLLVIFFASWWAKKNAVRWVLRISTIILWVLSTPWAADLGSQWWESPRISTASLPATSDVALVLGGLSDPSLSTPGHLEFNAAAERITEAVALWKAGRVKALLVTSGSGDLVRPTDKEGPGLAAWAVSMGVPPEVVFVEDRSRNTWENATLSLPIAVAQGFKSFVLVTSAAHMPRSAAVFQKAGYAREGRTLVLWPVDTRRDSRLFPFNAVPDPLSLMTVQSLIKEMVGYGVYSLQGYL